MTRLDIRRHRSTLWELCLDFLFWLADNDTMAGAVIGRDEELAAIGAFLDSVWSGPRALVFAGEAGIGKTLLWEAGVAQAPVGRRCRGTRARPRSQRRSFRCLTGIFSSC